MSEQKRKIGFTVACVNEFANKHNLSAKEAFQYLFQFKGIAFIKENYDVEHTLDFETVPSVSDNLCIRLSENFLPSRYTPGQNLLFPFFSTYIFLLRC